MLDRLRDVLVRRRARPRACASAPLLGQRRVDDAEHAVRLAIGRRDLQRLLRRRDRLRARGSAAGTARPARRGCRPLSDRAPSRACRRRSRRRRRRRPRERWPSRNCAYASATLSGDAGAAGWPARGCRASLRRRARRAQRRRQDAATRTDELHTLELFHKSAEGVI